MRANNSILFFVLLLSFFIASCSSAEKDAKELSDCWCEYDILSKKLKDEGVKEKMKELDKKCTDIKNEIENKHSQESLYYKKFRDEYSKLDCR